MSQTQSGSHADSPSPNPTEGASPAVNSDDPVDALDSLESADRQIASLLAKWRSDTDTLREGDDIDVRWERGSAAKLLLQHFAVRESAKDALSTKLRADGHTELAEQIEGERTERRTAIAHLDEEVRGRQAMSLNTPDVDRAVVDLGRIFDEEHSTERGAVIPGIADALGPSGDRDLPSVRSVESKAVTHPSPEPGVTDKVGPLKAARALYQHLRGTPSGGTSPGLDGNREHTPGITSSPVED